MAKHRTRRGDRSRDKLRVEGGAAWIHEDPRFRSALRRLDAHGFAWDDVASAILPVFERARPFSYPVDPPALTVLPPGVTVGFGVDAGPAFMRISTKHLAHWPVDLAALASRALDNLTRRAHEADQRDLLRDAVDDVPVIVFRASAYFFAICSSFCFCESVNSPPRSRNSAIWAINVRSQAVTPAPCSLTA